MNTPIAPTPEDHDRLRALEERLTFQQRLLEQFDEALLRQQGEIERLKRDLTACRAAIEQSSLGEDLPHEKPPHY